MRRPRGTTDVGSEPTDFTSELQIQLVLFSEWLELQGFSKDYVDEEGALTHSQLAQGFLGQ